MRVTTADGYSYEPAPAVTNKPPYPPELAARSKNFLDATLTLFQPLGPVANIGRAAFHKYPVHAARATSAAAVMGVDPVDLLTGNLCYDILAGTVAMGCSTLALPGPDGPVLARNMDWFPAEKIAKASCLVAEDFGVSAGFLGGLGAVTGLSKNGFCVCINAAFGGTDPGGYPMLLFLRHVLDTARNFADALGMVEGERLMSGGLVTVVGTRNDERAVVERMPSKARVRRPNGDEPLVATNHYRELAPPTIVCDRYACLAEFAGRRDPMDLLTDRRVLQSITAQHVVMCPATQAAAMYVPSHLLPDSVQETVTAADLFQFAG
ncbi:Peptidase C45 acyl-coenzyme A:6-aminopenicillanic acid acyl-transferase OS=Deinococcus maricopensis (strain DSM 21211 / LMG 22137 / NRRL B-23946 / LB-34) GN=Deima_2897 PE=4 SV=1: AAT [Gemmataceae bacterium]|nr:Peptidase C45 acyl-coenzyme A:6-aminopenicillanic acid acyl-transferase OS=Deinococcus maricopensis (strain DSM 21211 / LMG 22137 / NRRL B-23946 / LB-34) GN=Deima_2897 PE=4 SV=1: AAT [Gemmataceae bacterium]VTT96677.1 Peptidase C45 acyl-coenzyme A:6-aminopenicillanic acid acyl-transferase OS=Deinococcus maricopensis (strain DSM 21211 / LMG 22137 / NRRL B-23946 / LB-34) GN=Deima_2897 PE=4 SV=1: AAT [Gemmataceae bacterium]